MNINIFNFLIVFISIQISGLNYSKAADVPVDFSFELETCIPQEVIWSALDESMNDSKDSWLWPRDLSSVSGEGINEESEIEVSYKHVFGSSEYTYKISEIVEDKTFKYEAVSGKHPFEGGATLTLETIESELTLFTWKGQYLTGRWDFIERRFFKNYSEDFFKDLKTNIQENEKDFCDNQLPV